MIQTLISAAPKVLPVVYDILEKDGNHEYGLKYNVDYGIIRTTHFKAFDYIDDVIVVERVDEERSHCGLKHLSREKDIGMALRCYQTRVRLDS